MTQAPPDPTPYLVATATTWHLAENSWTQVPLSKLSQAANRIIHNALPTTNLMAELNWQQQVDGDPMKNKTFWNEAMQ